VSLARSVVRFPFVRGEPSERLSRDGFRHGVWAVEPPGADVVAIRSSYGTMRWLVTPIGSTPSRVMWETKTGGSPLRAAGAMNPGEKAITCLKRSPLVRPSDRA
jgi:hypothetical protein